MRETPDKFMISFLLGIASLTIILIGFSMAMAEGGLTTTEAATFTSTASASPSASATATATETATALASETATVSPTTSPTPPANCPPPAGWVPVVVQQGQTLETIALQYNTTVDALVSANCLTTNAAPSPGSIIYVPPALAPAPTAIPCGAPAGWVVYIVQPGDTLYHIATLYRVTVAQLMSANCLTSTVIYTGQRLYVPNVATSTPSFVTPIPTPSDTATLGAVTDTPTSTPTDTPIPTATPTPTDTPIPAATPTPTDTPIPATPSG